MNELESQLLKLAVGFVAFLATGGAVVGYYAIRYMRVIGEAKVEEAEAKRAEARAASTARLAKIGEVAAAAAEEHSRETGIRGEEKAALATRIAENMLSVPPALEHLSATDRAVQNAVRAGVTKLRGSVASTTYSFTGDQLVDVVRAASGRPPPALPPADALKTLPRPPKMPTSKEPVR